jgi:hypothetical protein
MTNIKIQNIKPLTNRQNKIVTIVQSIIFKETTLSTLRVWLLSLSRNLEHRHDMMLKIIECGWRSCGTGWTKVYGLAW